MKNCGHDRVFVIKYGKQTRGWMKKLSFLLILPVALIFLSSCSFLAQKSADILLTDAKTAEGISSDYSPVNVTSIFPEGTRKVFCWFSWKGAGKNVSIMIRWYYLTEDLSILDYTFAIPRKEGQGGLALSMPQDRALPSGVYRITIESGKRTLKQLTFKVMGNRK